MTVEAWALFCMTETLLCVNPGPSALLVMSLALTRGQAAGVRATVGVLAANAVYFTLSASGLVAVHSLSSEVFFVIKWVGAAYLIWLGARIIVRSFRARGIAPSPLVAISGRRSFWQGFVAQGANPNLFVYFAAILPQFVDPARPLPGQVAILAFSSFVIEFTVLSVYAVLACRAGRRAAPRFRLVAERLGGGLLVAAGVGLASLRRE
jgi:homoserine/homoserine lactone efflux protein